MNAARQHETFISYSRQDKEFALEFAGEMKSAGYSVWLDQIDIPTGARWDDNGEYPHWSEYNWNLSQCQAACQNNPNCQGVAMSKQENYCQLFGSDGQYGGTSPGTRITQGDSSQPQFSCFIKR